MRTAISTDRLPKPVGPTWIAGGAGDRTTRILQNIRMLLDAARIVVAVAALPLGAAVEVEVVAAAGHV